MSSRRGEVSIHGKRLILGPRGLKVDGRYIPQVDIGNTVIYVDSGSGESTADGLTPDRAVDSIETAFSAGLVTANQGDMVAVMPGHSETITAAAAIDLDVAGVDVVGFGHGADQPQIIFNNAAATVAIGADGCGFDNIRFTSSLDSVAIGINVEAGVEDWFVTNCRFDVETVGTDEFDLSIDVKAGCHRGLVEGCTFDMDLADAVAAVKLTGASDRVTIKGNRVFGDYSTACITGDTTLSTNVDIGGNLLLNGEGGNLNAQPGIELLTGSTGIIYDNYIVCNLATKAASVVADTCLLFENYYNEDISGAATGGIIGAASDDD